MLVPSFYAPFLCSPPPPSPSNQNIHASQQQHLRDTLHSPLRQQRNQFSPLVRQSVSSPYSSSPHFRSHLPARLEAGCAYAFSPKEMLTNLRLIHSPDSGRRPLPCGSGEQLRRHWPDPSLPWPSLRVGHNRETHTGYFPGAHGAT